MLARDADDKEPRMHRHQQPPQKLAIQYSIGKFIAFDSFGATKLGDDNATLYRTDEKWSFGRTDGKVYG